MTVIWLGRINCLIISEAFFPFFLYIRGHAHLIMSLCVRERLNERDKEVSVLLYHTSRQNQDLFKVKGKHAESLPTFLPVPHTIKSVNFLEESRLTPCSAQLRPGLTSHKCVLNPGCCNSSLSLSESINN